MTLKTLASARSSLLALLAAGAFAVPAAAQDVSERPEGDWIALSGEIASADSEEFTLDYGDGRITIEMDEFDGWNEVATLAEGDKVTVFGYIDDGFWQERTIQASSVWNERTNSFHYASGPEEVPVRGYVVYPAFGWDGPGLTLSGQVTDIDGREFTLLTGGAQHLTVDTDELGYDPLDAEGAQRVDIGDRVTVTGQIEETLWGDFELQAESLMLLDDLGAVGG